MQGTLGATALGEPVLDGVDFASISPAGNRAVGCRRGNCFLVLDLSVEDPNTAPLLSTPEGVAWAPDGSGAALFSRTSGWIEILSNLGSVPEFGQRWNAPDGALLLSVAFDGTRSVIALGGDSGGIFEITTGGGLLRLADAQSAVSLVLANSITLYALDSANPAILRIPLQGGPTDRWPVPLTDPIALQLGKDQSNRTILYVSGRADQEILGMDAQTGEVKERTALSFSPSLLEPLPGGAFLLTSRVGPDSVLWSFAPNRGAFFIPAPSPAEDAPQRGRRR